MSTVKSINAARVQADIAASLADGTYNKKMLTVIREAIDTTVLKNELYEPIRGFSNFNACITTVQIYNVQHIRTIIRGFVGRGFVKAMDALGREDWEIIVTRQGKVITFDQINWRKTIDRLGTVVGEKKVWSPQERVTVSFVCGLIMTVMP